MADFVNTYLPVILSIMVPVIVTAVMYFGRQSNTTVGGTIRLETMQGNVEDLKGDMKEGFGDIKEFIEQKEKERREDMRQVYTRLELLEREGYNIKYRLESLERSRNYSRGEGRNNNDPRNGGERSAI